jgi:hypothetical protein
MSFGAMAAWQALLLIAGAAAAAVWLFRMKIRPPRVQVPTLLLWRRVLDQVRELTWWERIRRAVSLVATVVLAVALALAATRPGPRLTAASRGRTLIVLDSSWSMLAETASGTRWERAVRQARALAAASGGEEVALATTADGLVEGPTSDLALIETAIDRLAPSGGEGAPWPRVAGTDAVHFFTDGAVETVTAPGVIVHPVYEAAPNVAITAFAARAATTGISAGEAFLEIVNYASRPQDVRVALTRGTVTLFDQPVPIAAGEAVRQFVPLQMTGGARLVARVSAPENALAIDDQAVAWIAGVDPLLVTVVTEAPGPLADLLQRDPAVRASFVKPAEYKPGREELVIFDRTVPAQAPTRPALFIAPPPAAWLGNQTAEEKSPKWLAPEPHPVLAGVDPLTIEVRRAHAYEGQGLVAIARSERGTPLVSVVDASDRRAVVLGFAIGDSNLPTAPAFPVVIGNAIEWLARPSYGMLRRPGPVELPGSTSALTGPDGTSVPLSRAGDRVVARLTQPGLYQVDAGGSHGVIGVNVGDPAVSNLMRTSLPNDGRAAAGSGRGSGRPWWMYAVGLAFALAAVEWWTWQRRITV